MNVTLDTHATALAHITKVVSDLDEAHAIIAQLKADLHREQDRCIMLVDEMTRWRDDALKRRALNTEYETTLSNISLMTERAQENLRSNNELAPSTAVPSEALAALEAEFAKGNEASEAP